MRLSVFMLLTMLLAWSCDDDAQDCTSESIACYSFDVRQCQTDQFADAVSENDSQTAREEDLENWLENRGVDVHNIRLDLDFHDAVCQACEVCPTGDRYFIQVDAGDNLQTFNLLNLVEGDCCTIFN